MSVVTFRDLVPPARFDEPIPLPWTEARIEEATAASGATWTTIETITLDPVDADPTDPQARNLTTEAASDTSGLWYRVVFVDADGDEALPTSPLQNIVSAAAYATVTELARILKIRTPTAAQEVALTRVLSVAAGEINAEVDREADNPLSGWERDLAAEVNLERAVEHWQQMESPFGIIDLGAAGPSFTARDSWERHAHKLAPLKETWGFA